MYIYEKNTLDAWVASQGAVCPVTNEQLMTDTCVSDDALRMEIESFFSRPNPNNGQNNLNPNGQLMKHDGYISNGDQGVAENDGGVASY